MMNEKTYEKTGRGPSGTAPEMAGPVMVEGVPSLGGVDGRAWDDVADPRDLFQSRAWLRALEDAGEGPLTYLIARRPGQSRILGALPLFDVLPSRGDYLYWPELHFRDLLHAAGSPGGRLGLVAGSCAGFGTRLVVDGALPSADRTVVLRALRDAAGAVAADRGLPYVFFLFLHVSAWADLAPLAREGDCRRLASVAQTELRLPGAGFEDYLATLPRNTRTSVRREAGVFARECVTESVPLRDVIPVVAPMVANVRAKHGMAYGVGTVARRLEAYASALGDAAATALLCRVGGRVVGAGVLCRLGDRLYVTDFGRLDDGGPDPFVYFNAAIYEPVRHAYALGLRSVVTGAGAELGKARRGAVVLPLTHLAWAAGDGAGRGAGAVAAEGGERHWRELRSAHPAYFGSVWDELL
ncbi:peptidogalycan biosysnthesis protein [Nonomuraea sp. MCN248]|uniref:Peptidogalycan biosysnthesis protein n=1 Tax=Nonomuraea corallina TaxID=2989783 RepID=A0ABT4SFE9_9ACTN|nr:peptidogalycan biosysnthesis protein [Nonomuraea corallina]MDA0635912.1 peptidogalycan biosysnthesis protein [Nonomuraea corallina]